MIRITQAVVVMFSVSVIAIVSVMGLVGIPISIPDPPPNAQQRQEIQKMMETRYALNKPLPAQYLHWLTHMWQETSFATKRLVSEIILERLPASIELMGAALLLIWVFSRLLTLWPVKVIKRLCAAIPPVCLGIALVIIFGVWLQILPVAGHAPVDAEPGMPIFQGLAYLILPAFTLAISCLGVSTYWRRASGRLTLGLNTPAVVMMTLLSNLMLVETLFNWRGIGWLLLSATMTWDLFMISLILFLMGITVALTHFLSATWVSLTHRSKSSSRKNGAEAAGLDIPDEDTTTNTLQAAQPFRASMVVLVIVVVLAAAAPLLNRYVLRVDPNDVNPIDGFLSVGAPKHLLGTDNLGRDQLGRLLLGTQTSLILSAVAGAIATFIAFVVAGFAMRVSGLGIAVIDTIVVIVSSIPILPILSVLRLYDFRSQGWIIFLAIFGWPAVLGWSQAVLSSTHGSSLLSRLRGVMPVFALATGMMLILEISTSFLGFGVQPPTPSWGNLMRVFDQIVIKTPAQLLIIAAVISLTIFCLYAPLFHHPNRRQPVRAPIVSA